MVMSSNRKKLTPIIYQVIIQNIIKKDTSAVEELLTQYKFPIDTLVQFCIHAITSEASDIAIILMESVDYSKTNLHMFLEIACMNQDLKLIKYIFNNKEIDPYCPERANVIHRAIENRNPDMQDLIVKHF
jgi:hypothetical protein